MKRTVKAYMTLGVRFIALFNSICEARLNMRGLLRAAARKRALKKRYELNRIDIAQIHLIGAGHAHVRFADYVQVARYRLQRAVKQRNLDFYAPAHIGGEKLFKRADVRGRV